MKSSARAGKVPAELQGSQWICVLGWNEALLGKAWSGSRAQWAAGQGRISQGIN